MGSATNENFSESSQQVLTKGRDVAMQAAEKAKQTASDVASAVGQKANDATAALGSGLKSVAEQLTTHAPHEGYLGDAAEKFEGVLEDLTDVIRRNPAAAVLGGVALGFLIGRTLRR